MSVRRRTWTNRNGEQCSAWVVNYTDAGGVRRIATFDASATPTPTRPRFAPRSGPACTLRQA